MLRGNMQLVVNQAHDLWLFRLVGGPVGAPVKVSGCVDQLFTHSPVAL